MFGVSSNVMTNEGEGVKGVERTRGLIRVMNV